jgi:hypothetical protein
VDFEALLGRHGLAGVRDDPCVMLGLWPELTIGFVNAAYERFARANGADDAFLAAWGPGRPLLDAVAGPQRAFYEGALGTVLAAGTPFEFDYECSSDGRFRLFHMRALRLGRGEGILVVHSLSAEGPQLRRDAEGAEPTYRDGRGLVAVCGHCRRTRRADDPSRWDWVPAFVRSLPDGTTHGLCPTCVAYYYPPLSDASTSAGTAAARSRRGP